MRSKTSVFTDSSLCFMYLRLPGAPLRAGVNLLWGLLPAGDGGGRVDGMHENEQGVQDEQPYTTLACKGTQ